MAKPLFLAALEQPSAGRRRWLQRACPDDEPLRLRVEALLRAHAAAEHRLGAVPIRRAGGRPPTGHPARDAEGQGAGCQPGRQEPPP